MSYQHPRHGSPIAHAVVRALLHELDGAGFVPVGTHTHGVTPDGKCDPVRADLILRHLFELGGVHLGITLHFAPKANRKAAVMPGVFLRLDNPPSSIITDWHDGDPGFNAAVVRACVLADPDQKLGYWTLGRRSEL